MALQGTTFPRGLVHRVAASRARSRLTTRLRIELGYAVDNTVLLFPNPQLTSRGLAYGVSRVRRARPCPVGGTASSGTKSSPQ
jgi:hypothetical protein